MPTLRFIANALLRVTATVEREGIENIPLTGKCILTLNHLGAYDIPLIGVNVHRDDTAFLAADKYKNNFFSRGLINMLGGIWINREDVDRQALRLARKALIDEEILGIAPEGTRSPTGALIEGKQGAAYLATMTDAPIIPVGLTGPEDAFSRLGKLRRARLGIRVGRPYSLPPLDRADKEGSLQRNTDEIMCQIAVLLPPKYRGVYSDHPRLQELLAEKESSAKQDVPDAV